MLGNFSRISFLYQSKIVHIKTHPKISVFFSLIENVYCHILIEAVYLVLVSETHSRNCPRIVNMPCIFHGTSTK